MSDLRHIDAPVLEPGATLAGPVSYFPNIEKKYGEPMQHWIDIATTELQDGKPHMEVVAGLKETHGIGHGHANAIVTWVKGQLAK
ncbi:DUF4287 domain-containing protein [Demequina flava]|uniref:DUF4287 domain-containing protein n=1 Tax=Demequina flava TaxID=1095025 RepID=UPI000785C503|nr:DUF4287 domain-containing protein [Demequina flava]